VIKSGQCGRQAKGRPASRAALPPPDMQDPLLRATMPIVPPWGPGFDDQLVLAFNPEKGGPPPLQVNASGPASGPVAVGPMGSPMLGAPTPPMGLPSSESFNGGTYPHPHAAAGFGPGLRPGMPGSPQRPGLSPGPGWGMPGEEPGSQMVALQPMAMAPPPSPGMMPPDWRGAGSTAALPLEQFERFAMDRPASPMYFGQKLDLASLGTDVLESSAANGNGLSLKAQEAAPMAIPPRRQIVELRQEVPTNEIVIHEKFVEVPEIEYVEKIVEVPQTQIHEVVVPVPKVQVQEVVREVPRYETQIREHQVDVPQVEYVDRLVEVPRIQYVDKIVEVPRVTVQEVVHSVPKVEVQEIVRHVPKYDVQTVDRFVDVPEIQYVDKIVEVPQVQYQEVLHAVPKFVDTQEIVRPVLRAELQTLERYVAVPETQYVDRIVEVPQVQVQEIVRPVPRVELREKVRYVPKVETRHVERFVEVPDVQYFEKMVEVPQMPSQEVIRSLPKVQMQEILRPMPKMDMQAMSPSVAFVGHQVPTPTFLPAGTSSNQSVWPSRPTPMPFSMQNFTGASRDVSDRATQDMQWIGPPIEQNFRGAANILPSTDELFQAEAGQAR